MSRTRPIASSSTAASPFRRRERLFPYLRDLGISDIYASPILQARPGSMHGYDICDHSRVSDELGGEAALLELAQALEPRAWGSCSTSCPTTWPSATSRTPGGKTCSNTARARDTQTTSTSTGTRRTLISQGRCCCRSWAINTGRTLESGQLRLSYSGGSFVINYFDTALPVAPGTYVMILSPQIADLKLRLGEDHEHLLEYRSILTAIEHLPPRTGLREERRAERYREVAIIKRRLAALEEASAEVRSVDRGEPSTGSTAGSAIPTASTRSTA